MMLYVYATVPLLCVSHLLRELMVALLLAQLFKAETYSPDQREIHPGRDFDKVLSHISFLYPDSDLICPLLFLVLTV
jgi:hypothetical protein